MSNTLGVYNPTFYAQEALIYLQKSLGLAGRVHLGFDQERRTFDRGDTISIRRPSTFTAQDAPSTAQDLNTETVSLTLDKWREVKFTLTDKEMALTGDRIVQEHIAPAAYALADDIDQKLAELVVGVPHAFCEASAATDPTVAGILATWRRLFDLKVPTSDEANMHFMVGGYEHSILAALSAFAQWQGAGQAGVDAQLRNQLGQRYGFNFFRNQNRPTQAYANISDFAGALTADAAKGATSLAVGSLGASEVYNKGTILKFTNGAESGNQYVITADATMSTGAATVTITPGLRVGALSTATFAIGDTAALLQGTAGTGLQDNVTNSLNLAFHKHAFALAMGKLPDYAQYGGLGARVASVQDPLTGLAVRSRIYYVGASSKIEVALDVLYGVKTLNPDLACRYEVKNS